MGLESFFSKSKVCVLFGSVVIELVGVVVGCVSCCRLSVVCYCVRCVTRQTYPKEGDKQAQIGPKKLQ
jgi:hypothetical protein